MIMIESVYTHQCVVNARKLC